MGGGPGCTRGCLGGQKFDCRTIPSAKNLGIRTAARASGGDASASASITVAPGIDDGVAATRILVAPCTPNGVDIH